MSATVSLDGGAIDGMITLPATAIFQKDRQPAVWVVQAGRVHLRPVEVAAWGDGTVQIRSGLDAGEVVVRAGVNTLVAGEAVTPLLR
jgi:membrane fusion protein, multidrug efflux system